VKVAEFNNTAALSQWISTHLYLLVLADTVVNRALKILASNEWIINSSGLFVSVENLVQERQKALN